MRLTIEATSNLRSQLSSGESGFNSKITLQVADKKFTEETTSDISQADAISKSVRLIFGEQYYMDSLGAGEVLTLAEKIVELFPQIGLASKDDKDLSISFEKGALVLRELPSTVLVNAGTFKQLISSVMIQHQTKAHRAIPLLKDFIQKLKHHALFIGVKF